MPGPALVHQDGDDGAGVGGGGAAQGDHLLHPHSLHHHRVPHRHRARQQLEDGQEFRDQADHLVLRGHLRRQPVRVSVCTLPPFVVCYQPSEDLTKPKIKFAQLSDQFRAAGQTFLATSIPWSARLTSEHSTLDNGTKKWKIIAEKPGFQLSMDVFN